MRETCTDCAIKHLAQASILLQEARHGYPAHIYYSRGHLAEAEAELAQLYPEHSDLVRTERKLLEQDPGYTPNFTGLMERIDEECEVCALAGNPGNPVKFGSTSCEDKILSCVRQIEGKPGVTNPWAVCRASISCPGA